MNFSDFTDRISGKWAISYWQGLIILPIGLFANFDRAQTFLHLNFSDSLLFALMVSGASTVTFIFLERVVLGKRLTKKQSFNKILYSYASLWLAMAVVETYITLFYFDSTLYVGPQIVAPLAPTIFGLVAIAFIIGELSETKTEQMRLAHLHDEFKINAEKLEVELQHEQIGLIKGIQDYLLPQIRSMREDFLLLGKEKDIEKKMKLAAEIEEYSNETVRNLSHEINDHLSVDTHSREFKKTNEVPLSQRLYRPYIGVKSTFVVTLVVGGFQQLGKNGLLGLIFDLFFCLYILIVNYLGRIILDKLKNSNIYYQWAIYVFHTILATIGSFFIYAWEKAFLPSQQFAESSGLPPLRLMIGSILTSILLTVAAGRRKLLNDIITVNAAISNQAFDRQKSILEIRSKIAQTLHGPIQGRLAGIAMLIRLDDKDPSISNPNESKIIASLDQIERDLFEIFGESKLSHGSNLNHEVLTIQSRWNNLVEIETVIAEELYGMEGPALLESLRSVLDESISNAVRHGKSNKIAIKIDPSDTPETYLKIEVINDGIPADSSLTIGMGLNSLNKLVHDWKLRNLDDGRVSFSAII